MNRKNMPTNGIAAAALVVIAAPAFAAQDKYTVKVPGGLAFSDAARAELIGYGVDVSGVFHFEGGLHFTGTQGRAPGADPAAYIVARERGRTPEEAAQDAALHMEQGARR